MAGSYKDLSGGGSANTAINGGRTSGLVSINTGITFDGGGANMTDTAGVLSKSGGVDGNWDAGIWGSRTIAQGESIEFKLALAVGAVGLGIAANIGVTNEAYRQRYVIGRFNPGQESKLGYNDADGEAVTLDMGETALATDVIKIENGNDGVVKAYKNGTLIHTFALSSDGETLKVVVAGWDTGDIAEDVEVVEQVGGIVPFKVVSCTTAQRDAITAEEGDVIFNTTTSKLQVYAGGSWVNLH